MGWESEWGVERLLGRWRLEREISAHGRMTGVASFKPEGDGQVLYKESGELLLHDGSQLRAEQRYIYAPIDGGFEVYFHHTGELFEQVIFTDGAGGEWTARAEHLCAADAYASEYLFRGDGTFQVQHQVSGPRKDYTIRTVYVRD